MTEGVTTAARRRLAFAAVLLFAWGCSGGSSCMAPLAERFPPAQKTDNAVLVRVAPQGVAFLNQASSRQRLVEAFFPGGTITIPVNCFRRNGVQVVGDLYIANQGKNCPSEPGSGNANWNLCGRNNSTCSIADDAPAMVRVRVEDFFLDPRSPDLLDGRVELTVDTDEIYLNTVNESPWYCLGSGRLGCGVEFDTNIANSVHDSIRLRTTIKFTIDTKWDKLVSFEVTDLTGVDICGKNGSTEPECLDPSDLRIKGYDCSAYCSGANFDFVKEFILGLVSGTIRDQVEAAIEKQSCEPCGTGKPACPNFPGASSTCQQGVCVDSATSRCVPRFLGVEGRVSPGALLSGYGIPEKAQLDLSVAAGSSVKMDDGLTFGTRAGIAAPEVAGCVPVLPAPSPRMVGAPDLDAEASARATTAGYHAAIGISQHFLETAAYQAHQAGVLCLSVTTANFAIVNTGLFKTLLPSLGKLATRDGKDAPMMVVLRPQGAPTIRVGEGTFDSVTKKPIDPLITLALPNLQIDFYAMLDDRYARLFSLTADVKLPLSLIIEGCSSLTPALGDLKQLISNVRTDNSEMLAEDPAVLADLIPAVIGLAEPALAGFLSPIDLPTFNTFKLQLSDVKGVGQSETEFSHLGLYASIKFEEQTCATAAPMTRATLDSTEIPPGDAMRLTGRGLNPATAILRVSAEGIEGAQGPAEFAWRVNGGLWSDFVPARPDGTLAVRHPLFALEGHHAIEIRSRLAEQPTGISAPVSVGLTLDWTAPVVKLEAHREENRLAVHATDSLTPASELQFAYQLGAEGFSAFGPAREVDLSAIEAAGGLVVRVKDASGNVGEASWKMPTVAEREEGSGHGVAEAPGTAGCTAGPGSFSLLALLAAAGVLRRRFQRR